MPARPDPARLRLKPVTGRGGFELVHPPCVKERELDLEEAQEMLAAGETSVARDELIWLLKECPEMIAAHRLLGEIALTDDDFPLARGHFGQAYQAAMRACLAAGTSGPLPYAIPANQALLESTKGLAFTLIELGKPESAREVLEQLLRFDPTDPLAVGPWLRDL